LGSVVGLTSSSGSVVNSYRYDPYGNATSKSEQVPNPFQLTGALLESSTGLYKMGERYYDPSVGRFTQLDPLGNGYGYAGENPINYNDPFGLSKRKPKFDDDPAITNVHTTTKNGVKRKGIHEENQARQQRERQKARNQAPNRNTRYNQGRRGSAARGGQRNTGSAKESGGTPNGEGATDSGVEPARGRGGGCGPDSAGGQACMDSTRLPGL